MPVLVLDDDQIRSLVSMDEAILVVESAFRKVSLDEATSVPRQRCQTDHVLLHVAPAAVKTMNAIGLKAHTTGNFPKKSRVFLFDSKLGEMTAIVSGQAVCELRTGAATAVATKRLARVDAATVGLIGAGHHASFQLRALAKVRKIRQVKVFCPTIEKCVEFAKRMTMELGIDVSPTESAESAVREADIVTTVTSSRDPVLFGDWLAEGCHVNLVGSNFPAKAEADVSVFRRANLVSVDNKDQAKNEAGDFVKALKENVFSWSDVVELSHIITNRYPGRQASSDITTFNSLGLGLHDVALAAKAVEKAKAAGVGRFVEI